MTDLAKLREANARRFAAMQIHPDKTAEIDAVAKRLVAPMAKARYLDVAERTGVPWFVIAVIHEREASQSWRANIAQGDPWNEVSRHVPAGRGPFKSWEDAAHDALANCPPYAARNKDWSAGGALTILEEYNGLGYAAMGRPSPYVWASTDQYVSGKYVADHQFSPDAVDHQLGCAALIKRMAALDPSIAFAGAAPQKSAPVPAPPSPAPKPPAPPQPRPAPNAGDAGHAKKAGGAVVGGVTAGAAAHAAGLPAWVVVATFVLVALGIALVAYRSRK